MKQNRTIVFSLLTLCSLMLAMQVNAEITTIDIIVIGDDGVTGYINGTAINGSVNYYIDGIEVKGEFDDVWASISRVRGMAQDAYSFAGNAYLYAENNHNAIVELTLTSENNTNKIYMLRDELVAFENDYLVFKNDTNTTFSLMEYEMMQNSMGIHDLNDELSALRERHNTLELGFYLILISLFGLLVCFGMVIWIFRKQKRYINSHYKKLEKYIDVQVFLEKQLKTKK